jgi:peptidoglycan/xylan/chitin deacetylase (PgdA/CDA1 family)
MEIRISVDDGSVDDLRVLELLKKHGLTENATFYIAPNNAQVQVMSDEDILECSRCVDIGGHNLDHIVINKLDNEEQIHQMEEGKRYLENIIGMEITRYAPTRGWYNDRLVENAKKVGFTEFRTMKQGCTVVPNDYVLPITVHVHPQHIGRWRGLFEESKKEKFGYFHLTLHGWEIEKFGLWEELGLIFKTLYEYKGSRAQ